MKRADYPDLSTLAHSGAEFAVHVKPGARRNAMEAGTLEDGTSLRVHVTAAPEDGRANDAVRKLLARALDVAPSRLRLLRGAKSRDKVFRLDD